VFVLCMCKKEVGKSVCVIETRNKICTNRCAKERKDSRWQNMSQRDR